MHLLLKVVALYKSCDKVMIGGEWGGVCDHGYGVGGGGTMFCCTASHNKDKSHTTFTDRFSTKLRLLNYTTSKRRERES